MEKKRRIFVGYQLSETLQYEIGQWREEFSDLPVRWIPLEFLHITLVPPWYEEDVDKVTRLLQSMPQRIDQFSIMFETITLGPDVNRPRLMWARGEMPAQLFTLRLQIMEILKKDFSYASSDAEAMDDKKASEDKGNAILHTTLARFSQDQFVQFPQKQFLESIKWKETITSFSLIGSHLKRTGAIYETLAKIDLDLF